MICISTPYRREETTALALHLAAYLLQQGFDVKIDAQSRRHGSVHAFWDQQVRTPDYFAERHERLRVVIQFGVAIRLIHSLMGVHASRQYLSVLVPAWHKMTTADEPMLKSWYDVCVFPSKHFANQLRQFVTKRRLMSRTVPTRHWNSCLEPVIRPAHQEPFKCVGVFVDHDAAVTCAAWIMTVIDQLLNMNPGLRFELYTAESFQKRERARFRELAEWHAGRVSLRPMPPLHLVPGLFSKFDWFWAASRLNSFGWFSSLALTFGCPVLAWDMAPFDEIVTSGHNGMLVPCELCEGWKRAPSAVLDATNFVRHAAVALADDRFYGRMELVATHVVDESFTSTWDALVQRGVRHEA